MKKNDLVFLILSLILNILFLFITSFIINKRNIKDIQITVGLVELEKSKTSTQTKDPSDKKIEPKKVEPKKEEPKKEEPKKEEPKKEEPKKEEPKKEEPKKEPEKITPPKPENSEEKVAKEVPEEKLEIPKDEVVEEIPKDSTPSEPEERKKPTLEELSSSINKPTLNESSDLNVHDNFKTTRQVDEIKTIYVKSQKDVSSKGFSVGSDDDKTDVVWDPNNKEPIYPESAKSTGKDGYVTMILKINRNGDILSFYMEKGSGIPEINEAILRVVGTWKMKVAYNGFANEGEFRLNYKFVLDE